MITNQSTVKAEMKRYCVTIRPQFESWNCKTSTLEFDARSKADAIKYARREMHNGGNGMKNDPNGRRYYSAVELPPMSEENKNRFLHVGLCPHCNQYTQDCICGRVI